MKSTTLTFMRRGNLFTIGHENLLIKESEQHYKGEQMALAATCYAIANKGKVTVYTNKILIH